MIHFLGKGLQRQMLRSNLVVACFGLTFLVVAIVATRMIPQKLSGIIERDYPAVMASQKIRLGIQNSLAALRGWVAVGNSAFISQRDWAWEQEIWPAVSNLHDFAENQTAGLNVAQIDTLTEDLKELQEMQNKVENVAQTPDNDSALLLTSQVDPAGRALVNQVSNIEQYLAVNLGAETVAAAHASNIGFGIMIALGSVILLISYWFAKRAAQQLVQPISLLSESVEEITAGEKGQDLLVESDDELGRLAKSFNLMRTNLERRNLEISQLEKARKSSAIVAIVAITDAAGKIIHVNDKFCEISQYSRDELLGKDHRIVNAQHHPKEFWRNMWSTISSGEIWHGIICNRRKDGQLYWVDTTITPFLGEDGKPERYVAIRFDITHLKKIESELVAARDEALTAAKAKAEFLANMSHEIRTPINGVIGMTQLLEDTDLDAEQKDYVETIHSSGTTLLGVINDVLDFSKMDSDMVELEKIAFDPRKMVEEVLQVVSPQARNKRIELTQLFAEDIPHVLLGDPYRFRQVVMNLVSNALKFTEKGEVSIHVHGPGPDDPEDIYRFEVHDSGIGMTPEQTTELFNAFVQGDTSTTRRFGGTGLGLAICSRLVEMFGGEIGVESVEGEGSVFWFTGKFSEGDASTLLCGEAEDEKAEDFDKLKGLRALVIDDNETNQKILLQFFDNSGLEGTAAGNGATGLEKFRESVREGKPFDLIVLDYHMPDMNGAAVLSEIRAMPHGEKPRILIATSGAENMSAEMLAAGADRYFLKPVRQSTFFDALVELFLSDTKEKTEMEPVALATSRVVKEGNILVAEDNPVNQKVIARMLTKLGYEFEVVANGQLAIERYKKGDIDIVLMDCQMPEMDGYDATREIRKIESASNRIPIIAVTANALKGDQEKALAAGMDDYISKPVDKKNLDSILNRWMGQCSGEPKEPVETGKAEGLNTDETENLLKPMCSSD